MARDDIRLSPSPQGWDILQFVDGYTAQIVEAILTNKDNIDYVRYKLKPFEPLQKRYNISLQQLDVQGCITREYQEDMIITLNEHDPVRKLKLCLLNFKGEETKVTKMLKGVDVFKQIQSLKEEINRLKSENAYLQESLFISKTNVIKYIKENFEMISDGVLPLIRRGMLSGEEDATREERRI